MDKASKAVFDANAQCCDIMNHLIKEKTMEEIIKIDIPKGYEFAGVDDDKQQVVFEKIKPKYPKTYEECCKELEVSTNRILVYTDQTTEREYEANDRKLLNAFRALKICRDAYWKIAGDWEPDWENVYENHYTIVVYKHILKKGFNEYSNRILIFPTAEMRDAFYENFRHLIEICKELL